MTKGGGVKRALTVLLCLGVCAAPLLAQVSFGDLDLSPADTLLFTAEVQAPGFGSYQAVLRSDVSDRGVEPLTFYPEYLSVLPQTGEIQIQNRFGVFRTGSRSGILEAVPGFPSFAAGAEIPVGKIAPLQSSPDGRFLLYLRPTSPAYGELVMLDVQANAEQVVSNGVELSLKDVPARWAPSSRFFVYSRQGELYYFAIEQFDTGRVVGERLRNIGPGRIASVRWGRGDTLYYLRGNSVFAILSVEFFTRAFYRELLGTGQIAGRVPFQFDPNFDRFWIAPAGDRILFSKGGRNLFLYVLQTDDFTGTGDIIELPYLFLPRSANIGRVLWSRGNVITVLTSGRAGGTPESRVYRLVEQNGEFGFEQTSDQNVRNVVLSPDEARAAVLMNDRVVIRDYRTWQQLDSISHPDPLHVVWRGSTRIAIAGRQYTEEVNLQTADRDLIAASQADAFGRPVAGEGAAMLVNGRWLGLTDAGLATLAEAPELAEPAVAGDRFRVYLEPQVTGSYRNVVMLRQSRGGFGTAPLVELPEREFEPFPERDARVSLTNFTNGSRVRRREVSLVFDVTASVDGLTTILDTLEEYGVTATFFVNGDAIRQHPGAVREIAESGHEVGNLFYTYFNLAGAEFEVGPDFIREGLARNEDDYFQITGRELALLWHAPFYFTRSDVVQAAATMNYLTVGRDVDALDWVPQRGSAASGGLYLPSAELLERTLELKQPGSIIAMTAGGAVDEDGLPARDDYLFDSLDVLINALLERGYSIVPVSTLVERARESVSVGN